MDYSFPARLLIEDDVVQAVRATGGPVLALQAREVA